MYFFSWIPFPPLIFIYKTTGKLFFTYLFSSALGFSRCISGLNLLEASEDFYNIIKVSVLSVTYLLMWRYCTFRLSWYWNIRPVVDNLTKANTRKKMARHERQFFHPYCNNGYISLWNGITNCLHGFLEVPSVYFEDAICNFIHVMIQIGHSSWCLGFLLLLMSLHGIAFYPAPSALNPNNCIRSEEHGKVSYCVSVTSRARHYVFHLMALWYDLISIIPAAIFTPPLPLSPPAIP